MASDYDVGYGRPPKHSRFRKGQSGNPKGRPKRARDVQAELRDELIGELFETVVIKEGGKAVRVTKLRALVKSMFSKAAGGDTKVLALLLDKLAALEPVAAAAIDDDAADDNAIIEMFRRRVAMERGHD